MFTGEQSVSVLLEFRPETAPRPVSVPYYVLRYLESYAERHILPDGNILFRKPCDMVALPEMRVIPLNQEFLARRARN